MSLASGEFLPAALTPFLPQIHGKQELHELLHDACSGRNLQIEIDKDNMQEFGKFNNISWEIIPEWSAWLFVFLCTNLYIIVRK